MNPNQTDAPTPNPSSEQEKGQRETAFQDAHSQEPKRLQATQGLASPMSSRPERDTRPTIGPNDNLSRAKQELQKALDILKTLIDKYGGESDNAKPGASDKSRKGR